jgi:hypothetical protein
MIEGYLQVDLDNPLAVRYMERTLKSFECVSDIFRINVRQCVTPETLLVELADMPKRKSRSPQELASLHSNYRMMKRLAEGEKFWALEHDAYLRKDHEKVFRMIMSKWRQMPTAQLGTANEFWTTWPEIAKLFVDAVKKGTRRGPMALLHHCTDEWAAKQQIEKNVIYWPMNRYKEESWTNMTGVGVSVNEAYNDPSVILHSCVTQCVDIRYGGTVTDREHFFKDGKYSKEAIYNKEKHPDVEWITLDD